MPSYKYKATTMSGKTLKGVKDANDPESLRLALRDEKLYLIETSLVEKEIQSARLKVPELSDFCRQLNAMLSAGVSLVKAMTILLQRDLKPRIRTVYMSIYSSIQQGIPLSDSMENQGGFPIFLISSVRAAEYSGQLDRTMETMALYYEKEHRLNGKIRSAAFYPIFLLCLTVVIMMLVFNLILPKFFTLFEGMELPLSTRIVMAISNGLKSNWLYLLIATLCMVLVLSFLLRIHEVRVRVDRLKIKMPVTGKLMKIIYTARFARTLSSLYSSGLTILTALQNVRNTIGNEYIASQFDGLIRDVRQGENLSYAVNKIDGFDKKLASIINIGEETGRLDYMLNSIAESFEYESEQAMTKLVSIIEPVLIIFMAIIVGSVIISVMLPIFSLYENIGSGYGNF